MLKAQPKSGATMKAPQRKKSDVCKEHKCPYTGCTKAFNRPYRLKQHISAAHTKEKEHVCTSVGCQKAFASKYKLRLHIQTHNSLESNHTSRSLDPFAKVVQSLIKDPFLNYLLKFVAQVNQAASTVESSLVKCHIAGCCKMYASKQSMLKHVKKAHILAKSSFYCCATCGSRTKTLEAMRDHWFAHVGLKPYRCEFCQRLFSSKNLMKKHISNHVWYLCNIGDCDELVEGKKKLSIHKLKCHDIGRVTCDYCEQVFDWKWLLSRHIRAKHFPHSYICTQCSREYNYKRNLDLHVKTKHNFLRVPCNLCDKTFSCNKKLVDHMALHQPGYISKRVYPKGPNRKKRKDAGIPRINMAHLLAGTA